MRFQRQHAPCLQLVHCYRARTAALPPPTSVPAAAATTTNNNRDVADADERRFGVVDEFLYARRIPSLPGAQWTGVVTGIALAMLQSGAVDAVVCVQSDPEDR